MLTCRYLKPPRKKAGIVPVLLENIDKVRRRLLTKKCVKITGV